MLGACLNRIWTVCVHLGLHFGTSYLRSTGEEEPLTNVSTNLYSDCPSAMSVAYKVARRTLDGGGVFL